MPLAVVQRSPAAASFFDRLGWQTPAEKYISDDDRPDPPGSDEDRPGQMEVWSAIQCQKEEAAPVSAPYVHPLVRRSLSSLSQRSLEICTESLGSETGSDEFFSSVDGSDLDLEFGDDENEEEVEDFSVAVAAAAAERPRGKELTSVNYHCSISMRSPVRSFPPPLPSISRRDGRCIQMRPHRRDGRLVVEAVCVPSQNYLHAQRVDGRLLLSFIEATYGDESGYDEFTDASECTTGSTLPREQEEEHDVKERQIMEEREREFDEEKCYEEEEEEVEEKNCYEEEEEEEEVEVLDRGTMVEVKVSTQPQQQTGAMKVHRSSLVINKFVGGMPQSDSTDRAVRTPEKVDDASCNESKPKHTVPSTHPPRRASPPTTSAAAAAAAAASTLGSYGGLWLPSLREDHTPAPDTKLLFTSKRRNREGLLHDMRRCSQLRRPLFIWEPWCIATSS